MNIMPNATLVVQMIHFGIAHQIITRFLCKPVMNQLGHEEQVRELLYRQINAANSLIDQTVRTRNTQWADAHQFFIQHRPQIDGIATTYLKSEHIIPTHITTQEVAKLTDQISDALLRAVMYDIE